MDCKTARLLLPFAGPTPGELPPREADDLEAHLDACPECASAARAERALDEPLGHAMRAVEVPDRLKARLLARLAEQRRDERRRRLGGKLRYAVPAAAVLLVAVSLWAFGSPFKDGVNLFELVTVVNKKDIVSQEPREVEETFRRMGVETKLPPNFNYAYLTHSDFSELPGHKGKTVPHLTFLRPDNRERVEVYILSARQFKLQSLANMPDSDPGYTYKLDVDAATSRDYAYVILFTGKNYDWLKPPPGSN
jgi:Putative zinc-finger